MISLPSLLAIAAFVYQAHAIDESFARQSVCGQTVYMSIGSGASFFTPDFPLPYSPTVSCLWSFIIIPDGVMTIKCAGGIPCTDSFTFASPTGSYRTFCGANAIEVTAESAMNITLKPSSTSVGGAVFCSIMSRASSRTTLSPMTPVMTTKLSLTTPVQTTSLPPTTRPATTSVPLTTLNPTKTPPRTMPATPSPALTSKPTILATPVTTAPSSSCTCGIQGPGLNRIFGGGPAGQTQFPWMVMLAKDYSSLICAGSIIAPGWVLTAAHCTDGFNLTASRLTAMAGRYSPMNSSVTQQFKDVAEIFQHPLYNKTNLDNDIALLKLATTLTFGPAVSAICLPLAFPSFDFANQTGIAAGWGKTSSGGTQSNVLLQVTTPILTTSQCRQQNILLNQVTNNVVCTHGPGRSLCPGDSGGPLMWVDPTSKRTLIVGINSWGFCNDTYPSGYAKANNYLSWIQTITGEKFCSP